MKGFVLMGVVLLALVGCDKMLLGNEDAVISLAENLQPPPAMSDGWDVSDLPSEGINAAAVRQMITDLQANPQNIHSVVIIRHNKLVSESYFDGWHRDRLHALRSDSKTFISTLIGIAIDQGKIEGVEKSVLDYFPEYADLKNPQKDQLRIKHVLTMTAGLQWNEATYSVTDPRNDEYAIERSDDRLRFLLQKELVDDPGTYFLYNSAMPILQSAIIKKSTGMTADAFAKENLFDPLGITHYFWRMSSDGYVAVAPLFLVPRDMAKLGQLFLDSGRWKSKQILSKAWAGTASSTIITGTSSFEKSTGTQTGYGYNWWTEKFTVGNTDVQTYAAEGSGGQYIFVIPEKDAVVVFTGGNYTTNQYGPFRLMQNVILPAMR